jgi:hypothetical protein
MSPVMTPILPMPDPGRALVRTWLVAQEICPRSGSGERRAGRSTSEPGAGAGPAAPQAPSLFGPGMRLWLPAWLPNGPERPRGDESKAAELGALGGTRFSDLQIRSKISVVQVSP